MEPDFTHSKSLNNVSNKKLQAYLDKINSSTEDERIKNIRLIAVNRYAESNIPVEYWDLKMKKDFVGDPRLLNEYNEYIKDIKNSYVNGKSICFAGQHGSGKQISLDTELPTPNGFIKLIDLKEGDILFDEQGNPCKVTKLHPIDLVPESYEIIFDDDTKVEACADHLWLTWDRKSRISYRQNKILKGQPKVRSTKDIFNTLKVKNSKVISTNHTIQCCKPINYDKKELLIDPYVLGCWLGDGNCGDGCIESADQEILDNIKLAGYSVNLKQSSVRESKSCAYRIGDIVKNNDNHDVGQLALQLKQLNLLKNKHIPDIYLYSSYEQRLFLLQGLLDTDGSCSKSGSVEFSTCYSELANQIQQLVASLGIKCKIKINEAWLYDKQYKDRYRIGFTTKLPIFRLKRKLNRIRLNKKCLTLTEHRRIIDVVRIQPKPMRCITVDSPSHLFLITRNFIPTHNTFTSCCILKEALHKGYTALYTTLSDVVSTLLQSSSDDKFLARRELNMVDFLVIDEFDNRFIGSDSAADLYARSLESVFRTRSQNKMPTLMATNSPNIIESFKGSLKDSLDSIISGHMKIFTVLPGKDFRKQ